MSVDTYTILLYGKEVIHNEYSGKECCEKQCKSWNKPNYCPTCGTLLNEVNQIYIDDVYPAYDTYHLYDNKYMVGKEVHCLISDDIVPPEELKLLPIEKEILLNNQLGKDCKYFIFNYCSI
jgi:hypothetical protein